MHTDLHIFDQYLTTGTVLNSFVLWCTLILLSAVSKKAHSVAADYNIML